MAVKIRLSRRGRKKLAMFDVVVSDARAPRDGRFIEKLGTYNPNTNPATVVLNEKQEECICYSYELSFLLNLPECPEFLIKNCKRMLKSYECNSF